MRDRRAAPDLDVRFGDDFYRNAIRGGAAGLTCDQRNFLHAALPRRGAYFTVGSAFGAESCTVI
jgi:hypothetical protein